MPTTTQLQHKSSEKQPPFNEEAERAVLGAILLDNAALLTAVDLLHPTDFFKEKHQKILDAMLSINQRGDVIDLLVLRDELERAKTLDEIGGPAYLVSLVDVVPTASNISYHAKAVNETARLRRLQNACLNIAYKIYEENAKPCHELLTALDEELLSIRTDAETPWAITSSGKPVAIMQREYVRFLESIGFRATIFNQSLLFTKIEQRQIIKKVEWFKNLCFTLKTELKNIYEAQHPLLWELLLKEHKFDYHVMTSLATIQQEEFIEDDAEHCHLFFKNGCVTITKEAVKFREYENLQGFVWEDSICPYDYQGYSSPKPAYDAAEDFKLERTADFEKFIKHVSNEFVDGKHVNNMEVFEHGLASLCWHHNDVLSQKAVVVIDNDPSYFSDGRRGKRILMDALRYIRSNGGPEGVVIKEDGKAFGGNFKFQRVRENTKILIIDDVDEETVNFKQFYSAVTDGLVKEGKGMQRFAFTPETSPKICFTTNRPFFGMDRSSTDRLLILPMTDFFTKDGQKPAQVFGHRLFYDWDSAEWARFHDYMICIIQEAMRRDPLALPEPDLSIFNANRILLEIPEALVNFFDAMPDDIDHARDDILAQLAEGGFTFKKQGEFKQTLDKYCRLRGRHLHHNTKDNRYKRGGVEYIRFTKSLFSAASPDDSDCAPFSPEK
jgi:hypothetical protein